MKKIINKILKFLRELFTEADNHTADIGCVLFCFIVGVYCFCSVYATVIFQQSFDWQGAGVGAGAILGGAGILFGMKKQSEEGDGE